VFRLQITQGLGESKIVSCSVCFILLFLHLLACLPTNWASGNTQALNNAQTAEPLQKLLLHAKSTETCPDWRVPTRARVLSEI